MNNSLIEKIFLQLEDDKIFDEYLSLYLLDVPRDEDLKKNINVVPLENDFFVFARGYNDKLKVNTKFDVIIPRRSINESIYCRSILKYVSVNPNYEIDYLPCGYSAIGLLEFPDGKPELLKRLAVFMEKKDYTIHDSLILTQKAILDKILSELKE